MALIILKNTLSYAQIENELFNKSGLKVELISPKTTFDHKFNLNFSSEYLNVYDKNKSRKFIEIKNPKISLKPLGLLFNKIYFKNLSADFVNLNIKRNNKGEIDLLTASKIKDIKFPDKKITINRLDSNINKIEFYFEDDYKIKSQTKLVSDVFNLNISKKNKSFTVRQKGIIETLIDSNKQTSDFSININSPYPVQNFNSDKLNLDININNINLSLLNDLARNYISKDIDEIQGNSTFKINTVANKDDSSQKLDFTIENPTIKLNDGKIISPYKKGIKIESFFLADKKLFHIENFKIDSNELLISLKGDIKNPFSKNPKTDLDINISNTQLNNFLYFLPDNLIYYRPKGIPTLKKSNFHAVLDGNIKIANLIPVDISGNLKASNVHIPDFPKPYRQNDVNINFMKDKMRVYTRVYTPENEYVTVEGISNLDDSLSGKYNVTSTKKIDLKYAQMYLVPIQQIIGFNIGPVPIMDISGYGNIDIKTKGSLYDAQIFGNFEAYQANAKIEGLDAKLTNGKCRLIFDDRNLIFKEVRGKMDNAEFLLTGMGNTVGEVKLNAKIKNAKSGQVLKIFNNSIISKPYTAFTKDIAAMAGDFEADINLEGKIKDYEDKNFFESLLPSGNLNFKNNKIILNNGFKANNITGILNFGSKQSGLIEFLINNSKINAEFSSVDSLQKISSGSEFEIKSKIYSNSIQFLDILKELQQSDKFKPIVSSLNDFNFFTKLYVESKGKISLKNLNLKNIKNQGYIIGLNSEKCPNVHFNSGLIKINDNKLIFNNFDTLISHGNIKAQGEIKNFLEKRPIGNLNVSLKNISLDKIENIIPKIKISQSTIKDGNIVFKQDSLKLNSMSMEYQNTPIFFNAEMKNIYDDKKLSMNFSTILDEQSSDNIINPYLTYPVKVKGELPLKGNFRGNSDNYTVDFIATIPKDADISFSGANLGDTNHKREFQGKIEVKNNIAKIHDLKLIKYIANQNNKTNPITALKTSGQIAQINNELHYNNLKIITNSPINVRVLNLIFKKSLLKKGNFECNINLNGNIKSPKVTGKAQLQDLDIPLYDTQINNIKIDITDKFADAEILAKNKQSDIKIFLNALNNIEPPYIINNLDIISNKIDIMDVLQNLQPHESKTDINVKQELVIKPSDIIIKHGSFDFKDVQYEKISAQNLKGEFSYKDNIFNLNNAILDIAKGKINANGKYNTKSTVLDIIAQMHECDSNILTKDFLRLPDQIYGVMNGSMELKTKALNTPEGIKNTKSKVVFSINDGKMPKLGSLEYLLRAGNLIKNGLLGLSLNNIIQVLTPYKTGEFEKITGELSIQKGMVEKLEIMSQGKNLSLYLSGTYSILENLADIRIYGKLSQNISNALGAIGNASINQFIKAITQKKEKERSEELAGKLNKIPPIEIENPEPRYFSAKVLGDINKDNYIKSFNWE